MTNLHDRTMKVVHVREVLNFFSSPSAITSSRSNEQQECDLILCGTDRCLRNSNCNCSSTRGIQPCEPIDEIFLGDNTHGDRLTEALDLANNDSSSNSDNSDFISCSSRMIIPPSAVDPCFSSFSQTVTEVQPVAWILPHGSDIDGENFTLETQSEPLLCDSSLDPTGIDNTEPAKIYTNGHYSDNNKSLAMLSPSSSDSSDGGMAEVIDYNSLFPELSGVRVDEDSPFDLVDLLSAGQTDESSEDMEPISVVRVTRAEAKPEPSINMHHNYAAIGKSQPCVNTRVDKVPKYVELEPDTGFAVCGPMSKNAVLARENRRKKKEYIISLEGEIQTLKSEKLEISNSLTSANSTIAELHEEIAYLRSVIANETVLGSLLKNIPTLSMDSTKRSSPSNMNSSDATHKKRKLNNSRTASKTQPGVCLHVTEGTVSLEFCKKCNDGTKREH